MIVRNALNIVAFLWFTDLGASWLHRQAHARKTPTLEEPG